MKNFNEEELKKIFKELVEIHSPSLKEKEVAKHIIKFLENIGAEIYLDESQDTYGGNCPTIFAHIKGEGQGVTFSAHMDVVEPNKNVKIVEEEKIIRTDGNTTLGGDDKAGLATVLYAIKYLKENKIAHRDIYCIFTPGEEAGMLGAQNINWKEVYKNINPAKNMIVVDNAGPSCHVAYQAPCASNYFLKAYGKTSHAGINPEAGINAIKILAETISKIKLGRIDEITTANISEIHCDFPTNVVPDYAYCHGEMRSHKKEKLEQYLSDFEKIGKESAKKYGGKFEIEKEFVYPPLTSKDDLKFAKEFQKIYADMGIDADLQIIGGGSDANFFAEEGFNSIIIGAGMEKVHTKEEYVVIEEFIKAAKAIIKYLTEF